MCKRNHFSKRWRWKSRKALRGAIILMLCCSAVRLPAAANTTEQQANQDLTGKSLDDLLNTVVTSTSKEPQKISEAAAAISVITQEDIRRSGVTSIAEALRMSPGLDVARINANTWAISSRGFNDFFANKLLVLMDGRSAYTSLFSGVFWDVQDMMLDDIDRIEVIRGPGASLWGANAVNGVINIISKSSAETQGLLINGGTGSEELGFGSIRYGGRLSENATYRVYGKYFNRDDSKLPSGMDATDEWYMSRGGFRTDWKISDNNDFRLQGDYYDGVVGQQLYVFVPPPNIAPELLTGKADVSGGNVLGSWKHAFSENSDLRLQTYYDRTEREDMVHHEQRDTYDFDLQHRFQAGSRNEITWGAGYRYTQDQLTDGKAHSGSIQFLPDSRGDQLASTFLQDQVGIVEDVVRLTLGSKFEHNDYTGFEIQPTARLLWTPHEKHSVWAAVSRAVRTPSRFEHTISAAFVPIPAPFSYSQIIGNPNYSSEELVAYELGYRVQPLRSVSFDLATFYNVYNRLRSFRASGYTTPPPMTYFQPDNSLDGETYGAEIAANWEVTSDWRLSASYTLLQMQLHEKDPAGTFQAEVAEGDSPQNQFQIRSTLNLPWNLEFDTALYYVDNLAARNVRSYFHLDARLGWRPSQRFELSVGVQNLLDNQHPEFGPGFLVNPSELERSVYAKATLRF